MPRLPVLSQGARDITFCEMEEVTEMKTLTIAYKCEYCGKLYEKKFYCEKHETLCRKNPDNDRPCFHCNCLEMRETVVEDCDPNADPQNTHYVNVMFCTHYKDYVYPPWITTPHYTGDGDNENSPMQLKCLFFDKKTKNRSLGEYV